MIHNILNGTDHCPMHLTDSARNLVFSEIFGIDYMSRHLIPEKILNFVLTRLHWKRMGSLEEIGSLVSSISIF